MLTDNPITAAENRFRRLQVLPWQDYAEEPCGYVVRYVREHWYGLQTPYLAGLQGDLDAATLITMSMDQYPWRRVEQPEEGDLVLAGVQPGCDPHHCGVWTPGGVVHWFPGSGGGPAYVTLTGHGGFAKLFAVVEFWRLKE